MTSSMNEWAILLVGGDERSCRRHAEELQGRRGYVVTRSRRRGNNPYAEQAFDLVLVVLPWEGGSGAELLRDAERARVPAIVIGEDDTVPDATTAFRLGVRDRISADDDDGARVLEAVGLILGSSRRDSELAYLRMRAAQRTDWGTLLGDCEVMRRTLRVVRQMVARSSGRSGPPILVGGETGTGKGMLARCIHYNSARRNDPFVDVNCATIPPNLIEAELFGHVRGAFTDAHTPRAGLFETAHRGSLFLDEIAALRLDLQAKLLTVTEERRVRRIGGRESTPIDVQLIAASHADLAEMVRRGEFREDLYHRLNVLTVEMPPLRKRGADSVLLAEHFVETLCAEYGLPARELSDAAKRAIRDYDWPGNVRELRNQIERIVLVADDYEIRPDHFQFERSTRVLTNGHEHVNVDLPATGVALEALERAILLRALVMNDNNVSRSARFLRISRQTMIYRMRKHEIPGPRHPTPARDASLAAEPEA
jgi:DNA-binding NtrC family response regulator